jgi:hypothetical protein
MIVLDCDFAGPIGNPSDFVIKDADGNIFKITDYMFEVLTLVLPTLKQNRQL